MLGFHSVVARIVSVALVITLAPSADISAQTPIPQTPPTLPEPVLGLPPGPPVTDWQPHARAVIGGTIVITGQNFRPAPRTLPAGVRLAEIGWVCRPLIC